MCSAKWNPPPHAGIKERIVQGYLRIWFTKLSKWSTQLLYLDGFAGPGIYENGMKGSPIIAMEEAALALSVKGRERVKTLLVFIEKDRKNADELRFNVTEYLVKLENKYSDSAVKRINVEIHNEDFSSVIQNLENRYSNIRKKPAFIFLDPFGLARSGFSFEWLEKISKFRKAEFLLNFYVQGIERNRHQLSRERVEQIFGESIDISHMGVREMVTLLRSKIKNELGMYVLLYEMKNRKNRTLYYLIFATKHTEGVKKMKEIMRSVSGHAFYFTNEKLSDQLYLFIPGFDTFKEDFLRRYAGQEITAGSIYNYYAASDDNIWVEADIRGFLKQLEEAHEIEVKPIKLDGKKRKKKTLPDNALIKVLQPR